METDRHSPDEGIARNAIRQDLDEVNDASFDSFPASDAPVWSSMHAGPPRLERSLQQPAADIKSKRGER